MQKFICFGIRAKIPQSIEISGFSMVPRLFLKVPRANAPYQIFHHAFSRLFKPRTL